MRSRERFLCSKPFQTRDGDAWNHYGNGDRLADGAGLKPIFIDPAELEKAGGPLMLEVRYAEIPECQ